MELSVDTTRSYCGLIVRDGFGCCSFVAVYNLQFVKQRVGFFSTPVYLIIPLLLDCFPIIEMACINCVFNASILSKSSSLSDTGLSKREKPFYQLQWAVNLVLWPERNGPKVSDRLLMLYSP